MKTQKIFSFLLFPFIGLLSSCSILSKTSGYDANPVFAPFHEKAGEVKATAGYGMVLGFQANISYSLTDRLAVMAGGVYNHQTILTGDILGSVYFKMESHYVEGALGYYFPVYGQPYTKIEIYAGLGSGIVDKKIDIEKSFSGGYQEINSNFLKSFLQITAKYSTSGNFEIGYGNRLSYIAFSKFNFSDYGDSASFKNVGTLVTEPVLILNYGKRLKLTTQFGLAIPLTKSFRATDNRYPNASGIFQLGVKYNIR